MKIIVTGVAGFIGSNLAHRLLDEGHEVVGIDNLAYGVREQIPAGVDFHEIDIRSKDIYPLFGGKDFVFHLAAKNCIADCQEDPVETADVNVTGTVNVFEASKRARVKKVIFAESSAMYEGIDVFPTPEANIAPQSFYAISKAAESMFVDGYKRFSGTTHTALRYFGVYGPRQDYRRTIPPLPSAFIIKLLKNEQPIIYGTGEKRRDLIHVDDINDFHLICMTDNRTDNEVFNLGSGKNYSVNEMLAMVKDALGSSVDAVRKDDLEGEAGQTLADITKARALGWTPKIGIKDGLPGMVEYIKKEIDAGNIST